VLPFLPPPSASLQNSLQKLALKGVYQSHQDGWLAAAAVLEDKAQRQAVEQKRRSWLLKKDGLQALVNELDVTIAIASQASTPLVTSKVESKRTPMASSIFQQNNNSSSEADKVTSVRALAAANTGGSLASSGDPGVAKSVAGSPAERTPEKEAQVTVAQLVAANGGGGGTRKGKVEHAKTRKKDPGEGLTVAGLVAAANRAIKQ